MDFNTVLNLTPIALLSFGGVWVINYFVSRYTKFILDTQAKLILSTIIAFVLLFIPVELQNAFAAKLEAAIGITVGITALYQAKKA